MHLQARILEKWRPMLRIYDCLVNDHNYALVLLAALVCLCGVATTMLAVGRIARSQHRRAWAALSGLSAASAIWSTHFIAMLAYLETVEVAYDIMLTMASFLIGGGVIIAGFMLATQFRHAKPVVLAAGALTGSGVVILHFIGMAAVQFSGRALQYDLDLVVASAACSIGFGAAAFYAAFWRAGASGRVQGAILLLLMTVTLHFTAMGAADVVLAPTEPLVWGGMSRDILAIMATLAAVVVLMVAAPSAVLDRRMHMQMAADADRFRTLADSAFEGIVIYNNERIVDCNPTFRRIVGLGSDAPIGELSDFVDPLVLVAVEADSGVAHETAMARHDGEAFDAELCGRRIQLNDGSTGHLLAVRDISDRKRAEARLNHMALHDHLTDLPNRRLFVELAGKQIAHAARHGQQFAIHVVDLDGFKLINDMHGHDAGDALLTEVGRRLVDCVREEDVVARFGGDEFVILETGTTQPRDAMVVAQRILDELRRPVQLSAAEVAIGASVGVSVYPFDGHAADTLLRNADTAMYRAKAEGKGVYRFFEAGMDEALIARRKLENRLRQAIADEKLELVYQPLVDSQSQKTLGFEALLRWHDEELGQISPVEFIPVAEETGLIIPMGEFVLRRACRDASNWPSHLRVAINLSAVQFRRPGLVEAVQQAMQDAGVSGERIDLEITESILIDNRDAVLDTLTRLKSLGIRISMDDFGTGYSSLSYLQSFPFDKIKIDRVFVADIGESRRNSSIIQAVVALGQSLSMKVVAEGVETSEQAAMLGAMHCDELQGYLIAKPMRASDVAGFVENSDVASNRRSVA